MALKINVMKREEDDVVICALAGSLDSDTSQTFTDKIARYFAEPGGGIILNLKDLDYISSMGISAVLQLNKDTQARNISLSVVEVPGHIQQVFKIVNALPNMRVFESIQEADAYFMEIQRKAKEGR